MTEADTLEVRVKSIRHEADEVLVFELRPLSPSREMPPASAGSHVDLHLANGHVRSYSLCGLPGDRSRYFVGVARDLAGRGGSRFLHEVVRPGDVLGMSPPRNRFALDESAPHSVFIAGGIGITPIWSMVQRLHQLGGSWELHYAARTRGKAAFLDRLQALAGDHHARIHLAFGDEPGHSRLDIDRITAAAPAGAHLYCCGPRTMLAAFEHATAGRDATRVHVEHFAGLAARGDAGGFSLLLARSGRTVPVADGSTVLDALLQAGVEVPFSCREGLCGTCEVGVLEGVPEHRDLVLTPAERAANRSMMTCCSGARTQRLVLDL